jgi:ABC-type polysaccharide/polyol phosphate export permease
VTRLPRHHAAARQSFASELAAAAQDFIRSIELWRLWYTLAVNDVASRYRGSVLGPFWITLSTTAFVLGISLVYGNLMQVSTEKYVSWMATGVVLWTFMSGTILESGDSYIQASVIIRQSNLPLPLFVWRTIFRNLLNLAHQSIVVIGVALWFHYLLKINLPVFVLGFVLVVINISWMAFVAAVVAARFRDMQQVIATALQLIFFVSPVIWIPNDMKGVRSLLLLANPFYHMFDVTRNPLLGLPVHMESVVVLLVMAVVGWLITYIIYASVRRRIVHYL